MIRCEGANILTNGQQDRDVLYRAVEKYIEENYEIASSDSSWNPLTILKGKLSDVFGRPNIFIGQTPEDPIDAFMSLAEETFAETLLSLIRNKGKKAVDIYTKAGISKQHFYKIKNNSDYQPTKETAMAFAVALQFTLEETADLSFPIIPTATMVRYLTTSSIYDATQFDIALPIRANSAI